MQADNFTFFLQNRLKELGWEGKVTVDVWRQSLGKGFGFGGWYQVGRNFP